MNLARRPLDDRGARPTIKVPRMDSKTSTATSLLAALRLVREHGSAGAALRANGIDPPDPERFAVLSAQVDESALESLLLGFLAGRVAHRPRARAGGDPTSFLMDRDLVVRGAEGESIMRLPWFEDSLFVGRQLPDISEMPAQVRTLCVENYSAALDGEGAEFSFVSYGHAYSVEAVPVNGEDGRVEAVLAVATPSRRYASADAAYERVAARLDLSAAQAERRADLHARAGRGDAAEGERHAAGRSRQAAQRARANAKRLQSPGAADHGAHAPSVTSRESDALRLASHGLTYAEIGAEMAIAPATVRTHLVNAYAKLGVSDKAAAVAAALRHGLID
jgi:DNA-binding CsgD family transcriptional regulator